MEAVLAGIITVPLRPNSAFRAFESLPQQIPMTEAVYRAFAEQKKLNFMLGRHSIESIDGYSDFIFLAKTGRPLMPSAVNDILYNIVDAYNTAEVLKAKKEHRKAELILKFSAHVLRHTGCTNKARQQIKVVSNYKKTIIYER